MSLVKSLEHLVSHGRDVVDRLIQHVHAPKGMVHDLKSAIDDIEKKAVAVRSSSGGVLSDITKDTMKAMHELTGKLKEAYEVIKEVPADIEHRM